MNGKTGIFLGRMQPLHKGHIMMIENMMAMHDVSYIIIGSADKSGTIRNPLDVHLRRRLIESKFSDAINIGKLRIKQLDDMTEETDNSFEWGEYLWDFIQTHVDGKSYVMHYSDDPRIVFSWFKNGLPYDVHTGRYLELFSHNRTAYQNGVSATDIRNAFIKNDVGLVCRNCHSSVLENWNEIKEKIEQSMKEGEQGVQYWKR